MHKNFEQEDRAELVAAIRGGESVAAAAKRFGVAASTAYGWLRRAGGVEQSPTFLELVTGSSVSGLVVRVGSAEIEVRAGFDPALLRAVVNALGGVS
jgi:transposase-like protein